MVVTSKDCAATACLRVPGAPIYTPTPVRPSPLRTPAGGSVRWETEYLLGTRRAAVRGRDLPLRSIAASCVPKCREPRSSGASNPSPRVGREARENAS